MTEQKDGEKKIGARWRRITAIVTATALLVLAGLYLLINPLLNAPQVKERISRILTDTLGQPSSVKGVRLSGKTFVIHGLSIANPRGFAGADLLAVRSIEVTPRWGEILTGRQSFSSVRICELTISAGKDSTGAWNFSPLLKHLASRKKSDSETRVGRLVLENSAVSVNGRGIKDISLTINDLSTKGSTGSGIHLSFRDKYGAPFRIEGKGRLGAKPDLDLAIDGPSLSFKALKGAGLPFDPEQGTGRLHLKAALRGDELRLGCDAAFDRLTMKVRGEDLPLSGVLKINARYDLKRDSATLDSSTFEVNGAFRLHARGRAEQLKKGRLFAFEVSNEGVEIGNIIRLLPVKLRNDLRAEGKLLPATFRFTGSAAAGVTSARAGFSLRRVRVAKGNRQILEGIGCDALLVREGKGWNLAGKLSQPEARGGALLRLQDIPFTATFSERMRPVQALVPSFVVRIAGVSVRGNLSYKAGARVPFAASVEMKDAPLAEIAGAFPVKGLLLHRGTVSANLRASGSPSGLFRGDATARLKGVQGIYSGKKIALNEASAGASFTYGGGKPSASGTIKAGGGEFAGQKLAASMAFRVADGLLTMSGADCSLGRARFGFAELSAAIPGKERPPGVGSIPLNIRFKGGHLRIDEGAADGLSGNLSAFLHLAETGRRLEGEGAISAPDLRFRGKGVGSLVTRVSMARGKAVAEITGNILDGRVTATASGDPFAPKEGSVFSLHLKGVNGAAVAEAMGKGYPARLSGGVIDVSADGDYSAGKGLKSRFSITGSDLGVAAKNGRSILNGGLLDIAGEWADGNLLVRDGTAAIGREPQIRFHGKLAKAAAPDRQGEFSLEMGKAPITSLLDAFANVLPRPLQEAGAKGMMALKAIFRVNGKNAGVIGELVLDEGMVEVPSQKLTMAALNGAIPFAMELGGKGATPQGKSGLTRKNYPSLLSQLENEAKEGHNLTIGVIRFGTTEFADTRLFITAGKGKTEIKSLKSGLFGGALLGRGFFSVDGGISYGADIMAHDLSLRELCNSYPAINGYMSGRMDGFVSIFGRGKGLQDLKGFVEFWSRSARGEKMLVSKEFLQKLSGKKLKGLFFQNDRAYDRGEISAYMEEGDLTFQTLDISHTNLIGIKDLSVSVAPVQNKISLDHLLASIREAATRGKAATGTGGAEQPAPDTEFKWEE